jgi:hypothetical protein
MCPLCIISLADSNHNRTEVAMRKMIKASQRMIGGQQNNDSASTKYFRLQIENSF